MTPNEFATVTDLVPLIAFLGIMFGTRVTTKNVCGWLLAVWVVALAALCIMGTR